MERNATSAVGLGFRTSGDRYARVITASINSTRGSHFRGIFWRGSIFDFFNSVGHFQTFGESKGMPGGCSR